MFSELPAVAPWVIDTARVMLGLALILTTWRLLKGPSVADRVIAIELVAALLMAQFILLLPESGFIAYLDVALAIAVISFLGTVASARYLENRKAPTGSKSLPVS